MKLSFPRRVIPAPWLVPTLKVQNSRIVLPLPIPQPGRFPVVFLVLRFIAQRTKLENAIVAADACMTFDDDVWPDLGIVANFHVLADDRIGSDGNTLTETGTWMNNCSRVN